MPTGRRRVLVGLGAGVGGLGYRHRYRLRRRSDLESIERALEIATPPSTRDTPSRSNTSKRCSIASRTRSTRRKSTGKAARDRRDRSPRNPPSALEDRLDEERAALAALEYEYRGDSLTETVADAARRVGSLEPPFYSRTEYVRARQFVGYAEAERVDAYRFLEERAGRTDYEREIWPTHERLREASGCSRPRRHSSGRVTTNRNRFRKERTTGRTTSGEKPSSRLAVLPRSRDVRRRDLGRWRR